MPDASADGAFEPIYNPKTGAINGNGSYTGNYDGFRLNASKSNTAYKENGKVTTRNLTIRYWKRIA